jgi:lipoprotein-releasing system ATP-binding protein
MTELPIYSAQKIHKVYRLNQLAIPVLKGLELDLYRGEILAIVGPSGVGKSTLLNILGLLDAPTSGCLMYRGGDASPPRDLAQLDLRTKALIRNLEFGFVFQFYHLLPDLTVLENTLLPAMIHYRRSEFRARRKELTRSAEELLERVGIHGRKDFPPTRLSGGERQRAAIARALMNRPKIVFCDEPTGNLDKATGQKIHELILELNQTMAVTFVIVTHVEELANLAHRRLPMQDGIFVMQGS